jgi:hypothetical protein
MFQIFSEAIINRLQVLLRLQLQALVQVLEQGSLRHATLQSLREKSFEPSTTRQSLRQTNLL